MLKVLVVDDALIMRIAIKNILEKCGYEVVGEAEDGVAAVKLYKEKKPDIVTMDITMPVLDGIESLKMIRMHDPKAKVIMISAMGQESKVRDAIINGAMTFIVKPFIEEHVIETIGKIAAM